MTIRCPFYCLLLAVGLAAPGCRRPAPPENQYTPADDRASCCGGYNTLLCGGSMYVGKVLSVQVTQTDPSRGIGGPASEIGRLTFAVEKTVAGPEQKELTLNYWWMEDDAPGILGADWACNSGPWKERLRPGDRLLLLLAIPEQAEAMNGLLGGPVWHVWRDVSPAHPLVRAYEVAVRYLASRDETQADRLYRELCRSEWRSIREFACDAAFHQGVKCTKLSYVRLPNYSPERRWRLVMELLRSAPLGAMDDVERGQLTYGLGQLAGEFPNLPAPLQAAVEKWYLTELDAVDRRDRCEAALRGLLDLKCGHGPAAVTALFRAGGRAALDKRLKRCVASPHVVGMRARELIQALPPR